MKNGIPWLMKQFLKIFFPIIKQLEHNISGKKNVDFKNKAFSKWM